MLALEASANESTASPQLCLVELAKILMFAIALSLARVQLDVVLPK